MINSLLNRNSKKSSPIKLQNESGSLFNTPIDVATEFNKHFSTRQTFDPGGYKQFLTNPSHNSMFNRPVDSSEIFEIIKTFKNKATLDSKIPALKIANESHNFTNILAALVKRS